MLRRLVYLFLLTCIQISFGQKDLWTYQTDSIDTYLKKDTIRANILLKTAWYNSVRYFNKNKQIVDEVLEIAKEQKSDKHWVLAMNVLSDYFYKKGSFLEAQDVVLKSIKKAEKIQFNEGLRQALLTKGFIEIRKKNRGEAIVIFSKIVDGYYGKPSLLEEGIASLGLGSIHVSINYLDYDKSLQYFNNAKKCFNKISSPTGLALTESDLSRFYKNKYILSDAKDDKLFQLAEKLAKKPMQFYKEENQNLHLAYSFYISATIRSVKGKHKESIPFYEKALKLYNSLGEIYFNKTIKQHLFIAYSINRQQDKAIKVNSEFVRLQDSIFSIEKRRIMANSQAKFDNQKLQNEKNIAQLTSARNKNWFLISLVVGALSILILFLIYINFTSRKKAEIIRLELEKTQNRLILEKRYRDSELKALKAQMNPHFVFNALNSIQDYIIRNKKSLAGDYLGKFADLIRMYLDQSSKKEISLFEEIETLKRYLELEKLRFEDKIVYNVTVDKKIDIESIFIPTMLIQPYIENSLKHGLLHKKGIGKLFVDFSIDAQDKNLICTITDNGIGRKKSMAIQEKQSRKYQSFATKANVERLSLLNHKKDRKISVNITDLTTEKVVEPGTKVTIQIPI